MSESEWEGSESYYDSEEGEYDEEEGEYDEEYDDYEEDYNYDEEEGEWDDEIEYDDDEYDYDDDQAYEEDDWDQDIEHEELPDLQVEKLPPKKKQPAQIDLWKEDDPADPRTWDEAKRVFGESDSEDDDDHEEILKEMMEAKIIENRKAILVDPLNLLRPRQIVERLNVYKKRALLKMKEEARENPEGLELSDAQKEKQIEAHIETIFCTADERFDPVEYLGSIHGDVSFDDLKKGSLFLNANLQQNTLQLKQFVQQNIQRYVTCKDTVDEIGREVEHNELSSANRGTGQLISSHAAITQKATEMYKPLYQRRREADQLRLILEDLERNRFLLNLPASIKHSTEQGEYEKALRTYRKAQELKEEESNAPFAPIMKQVDAVVKELQSVLFTSLEDPTRSWRRHQAAIQVLRDLQLPMAQDPFAYLIQHRKNSIMQEISQALVSSPSSTATSLQQNLQQELQRASSIFSKKLSDVVFLVDQYIKEQKERDTPDPSLPEPKQLIHDIVQHYITSVETKLFVLSGSGGSSKKKSSRRKKKRIDSLPKPLNLSGSHSPGGSDGQVREDLVEPQKCLQCITQTVEGVFNSGKARSYLGPLLEFMEQTKRRFLDYAETCIISEVNNWEVQEAVWEDELPPLDTSEVIEVLEDIIYEHAILWQENLTKDARKGVNERLVLAGLSTFVQRMDMVVPAHLKEGDEELCLSVLQCLREARTDVPYRLLADLVPGEVFSEDAPGFQEIIVQVSTMEGQLTEQYAQVRLSETKFLIREELSELLTAPPLEEDEEESGVSGLSMSLLLHLVSTHAQVFRWITNPTARKDLLGVVVQKTIRTLRSECKKKGELIAKNKLVSKQLLVDLSLLNHVLESLLNSESQQWIRDCQKYVHPGTVKEHRIERKLKHVLTKTRTLFSCLTSL